MGRVLALAAHPDDIEIMMAGTLLRLRADGWDIHYCNLGHGGLGSDTLPRAEIRPLRAAEARAACVLLGATYHASLAEDLALFYDGPLLARVAALVRRVAPDIILTHYPYDYMEDHSNTARLAVTAAFARGMPNFECQPPQPVTHQPVALYHAMPNGLTDPLRRPVTPDYFVDISGVIERKTELLACHRSQKEWLDRSQGIGCYLESMHAMMRALGRQAGCCEFAEGWIRHLHLGLGPADYDPLAAWACP